MNINFKLVPSYKTKEDNILDSSIYFMHIPKCGGTTIDYIFVELSSILKNFEFYRHKYKIINSIEKLQSFDSTKQKPKFISGHLNYDFCSNIENCFKCTIVREPTERIISDYKFFIHKNNKNPSEILFEDYIKNEISKYRDNLITRQFCGLYNKKKSIMIKDLDVAIRNINYFDIINTFDNWDNFLSDILSKFKLPSILYSKYQQHNYSFNYKPNREAFELIDEYYKFDFELYKIISQKSSYKSYIKNNIYNEKICIVSPYIKTEKKLYRKDEVSRLFEKKQTNPFV